MRVRLHNIGPIRDAELEFCPLTVLVGPNGSGKNRHGRLLSGIANNELYSAAVTVMMRLVFLFVAEERRLLPLDDPLYASSYAASTLRVQ